ncbi:unnamed protein product [Closterium sp. Naga37s-1]|nr:unnamed protein product [Closterium sp. Naga37s-1]
MQGKGFQPHQPPSLPPKKEAALTHRCNGHPEKCKCRMRSGSEPSPAHAVSASEVYGRSLPVPASETAAMKPPLPPAPTPVRPVSQAPSLPNPTPLVVPPRVDAVVVPPAPAHVESLPAAPAEPAGQVPPVALGASPVAAAPVAPAVAEGSAAPVVSQPAVSATTAGQSLVVGPVEAPAPPAAAPSLPLSNVQAVPDPAPLAAVPPAQRQPSPGRRQHRPHSPAPSDERETTRRRRDSPRRRGSQANWAASRGGRGGWWGGRGRGGDWGYDRPVSMADLQRVVSAAVREEQNGQASQSNSPRVAPTRASVPPAAPHAPAPPPPQSGDPPPHAPSASAAALGHHMRLPWVPPVAGMEFVTAAGGPVTGQYPSLLPVAPAPPAAALPHQSLVGPSLSTVVPEASLGQLWRLSEGLRAVHLIQVYGHAALSQGLPLESGHRDECLDAADRLGELLAPVLAAPARGGVAGVGQLGTAVRGLRRFLRAGTAVDLIGATTVVVRELHLSLTGLLAVLDADQM